MSAGDGNSQGRAVGMRVQVRCSGRVSGDACRGQSSTEHVSAGACRDQQEAVGMGM